MQFEEIFNEHIAFTSTTFPMGTSTGALIHLKKECDEVMGEIECNDEFVPSYDDRQRLITEYADCLGCLCDSFNREGIALSEVISAWSAKLAVNRARVWRYNGDGSYSHVRGSNGSKMEHNDG